MSDTQLKESMGGFFHDFFRAAGISMVPASAMERIRAIGERMASAIERAAERQSIEVIKRLQVPVSEGFAKMAKELDELKHAVEELALLVARLQGVVNRSSDHLQRLEDNDLPKERPHGGPR